MKLLEKFVRLLILDHLSGRSSGDPGRHPLVDHPAYDAADKVVLFERVLVQVAHDPACFDPAYDVLHVRAYPRVCDMVFLLHIGELVAEFFPDEGTTSVPVSTDCVHLIRIC